MAVCDEGLAYIDFLPLAFQLLFRSLECDDLHLTLQILIFQELSEVEQFSPSSNHPVISLFPIQRSLYFSSVDSDRRLLFVYSIVSLFCLPLIFLVH